MPIASTRLPGLRSAILLLALSLGAAAAEAQDPGQVNANLQELTQRRAETEREYRYWQAVMTDPNLVFVVLPTSIGGFPFPMRRDEAAEYILHLAMTSNLRSPGGGVSVAQLTADWLAFTQVWRDRIRDNILPVIANDLAAIDRDIQATRHQLAQPSLPPNEPGGSMWKLVNIAVGWDGPLARDITVVGQEATAAGGYIALRYRVDRDCFETWQMSWNFGQGVNYLRAGDRIPVRLESRLVEGSCRSGLAATVGIAFPRVEGFIAQAIQAAGGTVNQIEGSVRAESGVRVGARGADTPPMAQGQDAIVVERSPLRFPSFELVRIYAYVPGQFYVASYLFQGQGGNEIGLVPGK
jgi:hypothetical protein